MKLNNKGFAISVILYSMIILVIGIMYLLLNIVNTRYKLTKENKEEVVEYINSQGINTVTDEFANKLAVNKVINTGLLNCQGNNCYYYGNDPSNYVKFNNELWRIIGVMSMGGNRYLKIVRNNFLLLETVDTNKFSMSNVFSYLNSNYYNSLGTSKKFVASVKWYNSEYATNLTPFNAYNEELVSTSYKTGYIGIINGSDFGFAASSSYTTNNLSNYSSSINDNWLATTYDYLTMSYSSNKINIVSNGNLISSDITETYIYPSLYLNKDIFITSGTGTSVDPYILG